jgi:5-methylcytosine-specific restriction endonuclease McrA
MTFIKGYKQTREAQMKAKRARYKKYGTAVCVSCGKTFEKYNANSVACSDPKCISNRNKSKYKEMKMTDPIKAKAFALFSTIRLGRGKSDIAVDMLKKALDKPCKYCGQAITLDNASVDHKKPRLGSKVYNRKKKKMVYSSEEIHELDKRDNLHIICRDCNQTKSDLSDEQFIRLLAFLNENTDIKDNLFKRLKYARTSFRQWRK